jgi:hypothetical protein
MSCTKVITDNSNKNNYMYEKERRKKGPVTN